MILPRRAVESCRPSCDRLESLCGFRVGRYFLFQNHRSQAVSDVKSPKWTAKPTQSRNACKVSFRQFRLGLGDPFEEADDAHRGGPGVGGDVFAGVDFGALGFVVAEGFDHHLLVGESRLPVEFAADVGGVEDEVFGDHAVVVGAEG
jgi:hypothetical protein